MKYFTLAILLILTFSLSAQKKVLDHPDFEIWNTIQNRSISTNGKFIMYSLERGERDNFLKIQDAKANMLLAHDRGESGKFSYDSDYAFFTVKAWQDSVREMKRRKVKKEAMPTDSLAIYSLKEKTLIKIPDVNSYQIPEKWGGFVAYLLEESTVKKDKTEAKDSKTKSPKKVGKDNGYHLVVRNLKTAEQDTFYYVTDYQFAKRGKRLAFASSGDDKDFSTGIYSLNLETGTLSSIFTVDKGKFAQMAISETGKQVAFVADLDTTKAMERPTALYRWEEEAKSAILMTDKEKAPSGYIVSENGSLSFSKDESKLFFGYATPPILQDTSILDEEIVNVEVWTYDEPKLYTIQEIQLNRDRRKSYTSAVNIPSNKIVQLASTDYPDVTLGNEGNADYALVRSSLPYELSRQWQGGVASDYAIVHTGTGKVEQVLTGIRAREVNISPAGKYLYGYDQVDSTWITYSIESKKITKLTDGRVFYDELNDSPEHPNSYWMAGWTENDASLIIYDRYDLWEFTPESSSGTRLTKGRELKKVFRYIRLDNEERYLNPKGNWLLSTFDEQSRQTGYYELNRKNGKGSQILEGPYRYSNPQKAKESNGLIFTRQSFQEFPDIRYSDLSFKTQTRISQANPQQKDYNWGNIELVKWTSLDGKEIEGLLVKPENFDPSRKYPMIVNFYERSSNGLFSHRAPAPGRSTINYSFYASRGYLIFNPDIHYRIGYPGESAYNCAIPGITSLIEKGFVDKENVGVQGHSWGGYQIAYLVTRTNIFKAAEAGAPVPNMISAYGGIRWGSGMSRQFQYEHTQSRIGGTPWEFPARYIENSPIFAIDKINTPLLIMHNDADTAVPWYQGIEFFTALRRLGKPSWFLNYNGEPHWPVKIQNRKDFNIRMAQFFDHYLKGEPIPMWMERGVPAIEKGINQGYELSGETK